MIYPTPRANIMGGKKVYTVLPTILLLLFVELWWSYHEKSLKISSAFFRPSAEASTDDTHSRNGNILLQGQFNYDLPPGDILFWVQTWSRFFSNILVVGPFSRNTTEELDNWKISYRIGADDKGFVSPYVNLGNTLVEFKTKVDAVLYLHDDMIINVSSWTRKNDSLFPSDKMIRTSFFNRPREELGKFPYRIGIHDQQVYYSDPITGLNTTTWYHLTTKNRTMKPWPMFRHCIPAQARMMEVEKMGFIQDYLDADGNLYFPGFWQADALFVPTMYAVEFDKLAKLNAQYSVFLECAIPDIVYWILWRSGENARIDAKPFQNASLCTTFFRNRGKREMLDECQRENPNGMSAYHPLKISLGRKEWKDAFDWIQAPHEESD